MNSTSVLISTHRFLFGMLIFPTFLGPFAIYTHIEASTALNCNEVVDIFRGFDSHRNKFPPAYTTRPNLPTGSPRPCRAAWGWAARLPLATTVIRRADIPGVQNHGK